VLGPVDYSMWLADFFYRSMLLGGACSKEKAFSRHFTIVIYICASLAIGIGRYSIIATLRGSRRARIFIFYFYSDAVLTICLYFVLMGLYAHVFFGDGSQQVRARQRDASSGGHRLDFPITW